MFQIERTAVADPAAIGVGEPAAIEKLRCQSRWVETAERGLGVGRVGEAEGAHPAVAPALPHQPGEGVEAILGLAQILRKAAPRFVPSPTILIDDGVAVAHEIGRNLGERAGLRGGSRALRAARRGFVVRRPLQQHRKRAASRRAVHIRRQADAVSCHDHEIPIDDHFACSGQSNRLHHDKSF